MFNINSGRKFLIILISAVLLSGCTVKYVAEYDAAIKDEIVVIAKKVDLFWGTLLDTPEGERQYDNFKDKYNEIETDIRGLHMKNEIRALNKLSTKQVKILLELWIEDRELHKKENKFSDFSAKRHRKQFARVFIAIAKGEEAKNTASSNTE
jgi:hypothetical protein